MCEGAIAHAVAHAAVKMILADELHQIGAAHMIAGIAKRILYIKIVKPQLVGNRGIAVIRHTLGNPMVSANRLHIPHVVHIRNGDAVRLIRAKPFQQLAQPAHAFTRAYKPLLDRFGLTYPQYLVLLALWQQDEMTVKRIGEEDGFAGVALPLWQGFFVKAGTPAATVAAYEKALLAAIASPEVQNKLKDAGITPSPLSGKDLGAFVKQQAVTYKDIVSSARIALE